MCSLALLIVLLLSVSAHTERIFEAAEGYMAPELNIEDSDFSLAAQKGKFILVNFWSSTDAESRIAAKSYDDLFVTLSKEQLAQVSVNLDSSKKLCDEIIRRDGMSTKAQHHADAKEITKLTNDWHLQNGLRSFLIDPSGKIVAVNPSISTLRNRFGS